MNPNEKYGLAFSEDRLSFAKGSAKCTNRCILRHPFSSKKRQSCIEDCVEEFAPPEIDTIQKDPIEDPKKENKKLIKNILLGFLALVILLLLIWAMYALFKKVNN